MSFLDEVPQDWSRPEFPALRDLFVLAFRTPAEAERLAEESGLQPGTFPLADDLRTTWTRLIRVLGHQGILRRLVERAARDPSVGAFAPRFSDMLREGRPAVPAPAYPTGADAWWRAGDESPRLHLERLLERRSRLLDLDLAAGLVEAARSVARLTLLFGAQRAYGTGFLIGPDLLLTNQHNMEHPEYGRVTAVTAEFDYDRTPRSERLVRQVDLETVQGDRKADWAVARFRTTVDRPPLALGTPFDVALDDLVVIIQHPLGAYKQFALQPMAVRHVDDEMIQYVADTQDGSSGSPVFNERMHVIALHRSEAATAVRIGDSAQTIWRNQGIPIGIVTRGLRSRGIPFTTNAEEPT